MSLPTDLTSEIYLYLDPYWDYDAIEDYIKQLSPESRDNFLRRFEKEQIQKLFSESIEKGKNDLILPLLKVGADIHHRGDEALRVASREGNEVGVQLLLENKANVHGKLYSRDEDPSLKMACLKGHLGIVKLLLKAGANVNAGEGICLREAVISENYDLVKFLLDEGIDIEGYDGAALVQAATSGLFDITDLLISYGANVNIHNGSALKQAAYFGYGNIVELLVINGAKHIDDAIILAGKNGHKEIVRFLRQFK